MHISIGIKLKQSFVKLSYAALALIFSLISCGDGKISKSDIDKFITDYSNENFDDLKGAVVYLRSRGPDGEIYMINSTDTANAGPYVVEYESGHGNISAIKNNLVLKSGSKDYFTNKQIEAFMKTFFKYDFCLLGVDSSGNVIVNPFRANEPVFFLRLKETTNEKIVRKGYVYSHYKDNWYINNHKL